MQGNGNFFLVMEIKDFMLLQNEKKNQLLKLVGHFGESIKNSTLHSYMTYLKYT